VECKSHVGAGDCFAAHLTLALAHGIPLEQAAAIAHSAGRVYVQHLHGRPPYPIEIRKDLSPQRGKIVALADMATLREIDKAGLVFTNGCFDLLGPHHVYCLQQAKAAGQTLVAAINDDASVKRLKGPMRPIQPLTDRLAMLTGLAMVDWVVPFSEDTPIELLKALKPDVRVKANLPDLNHAGDEFCGKVMLVPTMKGCSTSTLLSRIRKTDQ